MTPSDPHLPIIVRPDQGDQLWVVGDHYRMLATAEQTQGRFSIFEARVFPGGGPPPHKHSRESEGFFVIEGEVTFGVGDQRTVATPGTFLYVPEGAPHWFKNESNAVARIIILITPGGFERMFFEIGQTPTDPGATPPGPAPDDLDRIKQAAARYGLELLID